MFYSMNLFLNQSNKWACLFQMYFNVCYKGTTANLDRMSLTSIFIRFYNRFMNYPSSISCL